MKRNNMAKDYAIDDLERTVAVLTEAVQTLEKMKPVDT